MSLARWIFILCQARAWRSVQRLCSHMCSIQLPAPGVRCRQRRPESRQGRGELPV